MKRLEYIAPEKRKAMTPARASRIFLRENGVCWLCGNQIRPGEGWDVDHKVALSLGGPDTDENLGVAHSRCHKNKTRTEAGQRAKRDRIITQGFAGKKRRPMDGSRDSKWRKPMNGPAERRT